MNTITKTFEVGDREIEVSIDVNVIDCSFDHDWRGGGTEEAWSIELDSWGFDGYLKPDECLDLERLIDDYIYNNQAEIMDQLRAEAEEERAARMFDELND